MDLGCGSSSGVPRPALGCGACDPDNPRNRRRRCSLLVERTGRNGGRTRVLVDTSPDLREQLLGADVDWLDGVFFTHEPQLRSRTRPTGTQRLQCRARAKKLIYLVFKWGWRGPVALALVIFGIWLFSELTN